MEGNSEDEILKTANFYWFFSLYSTDIIFVGFYKPFAFQTELPSGLEYIYNSSQWQVLNLMANILKDLSFLVFKNEKCKVVVNILHVGSWMDDFWNDILIFKIHSPCSHIFVNLVITCIMNLSSKKNTSYQILIIKRFIAALMWNWKSFIPIFLHYVTPLAAYHNIADLMVFCT